MTDQTSPKPATILVPGRFYNHALSRIGDKLNLVEIESADGSLVDAGQRAAVRGVAAFVGVDADFIDAFPNLEIIANYGVGYDSVDVAHAASRGVMVTNTPDVLTEEVADSTVGILISLVREFPKAEAWLRAGKWASEGPIALSPLTLRQRSIGVFGMGRIGLAIARRLEGFGLTIAYHNRRPVDGVAYRYYPSLKELAEAVDTLICIAPGGPSTEKAVNAEILAALGPNGVFVNTGRGSTVDEDALTKALVDGTIAAAGLDVFANEPNVPQALLDAPNTILLPHVASGSAHTRKAMGDLCADNLLAWFSTGKPLTPVPETAHIRKG